MVAVVLSRDERIGPACAAALAVELGIEVLVVADADAIGDRAAEVEVLVTVPRHPVPGRPVAADPAVHLADVRSAVGAVLPAMVAAGRGRIVLVVTATGLPGQVWSDGTAEAMGAAVGLARTAARQVAAAGVGVNVVRTGLVLDADVEAPAGADGFDAAAPAEAVAAAAAQAPLRRRISPADVAAAVAFLASPEAGYITGIVLPVDGGSSIGQGA